MSKEAPEDLEYLRRLRRTRWGLLKIRADRLKDKVIDEVNPVQYTREHPLAASAIGLCAGVIVHQLGSYELRNYRHHATTADPGVKNKQGRNEVGMILKTFLMLVSRALVTALVSVKTASATTEQKQDGIIGDSMDADYYH